MLAAPLPPPPHRIRPLAGGTADPKHRPDAKPVAAAVATLLAACEGAGVPECVKCIPTFCVVAGLIVFFTSPAAANVVWPAIILENRIFSTPFILAGLAIEGGIYFYFLGLGWRKTILFDVTINLASALVGVIAIPAAGLLWEAFPGALMISLFHYGTFNAFSWTYTFVMAIGITGFVELVVARKVFRIGWSRREVIVIFGANFPSVLIAFASLFISTR
ncbi:MAG: hypothetical protein WCO00_11470 [Rhodospirillaceae bacterium]